MRSVTRTLSRLSLLLATLLTSTWGLATTYASVEPLANPSVVETGALRDRSLAVREAFAERVFQCGVVDDVVSALTATGAIASVNSLNTSFEVTAGGFAGNTNPAYAYTFIDSGPNAASMSDIRILSDALGYVFSQGSVFLLDADDASSYDFPANYVVLEFDSVPPLDLPAALFEAVGQIDPELFSTNTSGYTQYGRAYLSLQSFVPDQQFIDGYVAAAALFGVEYTPVVGGVPGLFTGGAAFPFNDWSSSPNGEDYLARIPAAGHPDLAQIRADVTRFTRKAVRRAEHVGKDAPLQRLLLRQRCP